jgi:hypothetical protein
MLDPIQYNKKWGEETVYMRCMNSSNPTAALKLYCKKKYSESMLRGEILSLMSQAYRKKS